MSKTRLIALPYYQYHLNPALNLDNCQFKPLPNETIRYHYPFLFINAFEINDKKRDIAVVSAEDIKKVDESAQASELSKSGVNNPSQPPENEHTSNTHSPDLDNSNSHGSSSDISDNTPPSLDQTANSDTHSVNTKPNKNESVENETDSTEDNDIDLPDYEATADKLSESEIEELTEKTNTEKSEDEDTESNLIGMHTKKSDNPTDEHKNNLQTNPDDKSANQAVNKRVNNESDNSDDDIDGSNADDDSNDEGKNDDYDENIDSEEKKEKKEAKLEAYKQFVAEQKSKVDIDYQGIRVKIEANALPNRMYFIMNALSAIIASYGLVINSAAVVIGAMLVAMMLGPITGAALAIIDYRIPFLRKSVFTIVAGGAMVIGIAFIIGLMHQDTPLSNEILSRTQPTSMDLMIALAGGTAGAYAIISPHLSVAVVGVAVATALVPPLAASGILFAHGEGVLGLGALILAVTNIIAIQFTNALVLWFAGFRRLMDDDYKSTPFVAFFKRNVVPLTLLTVIGAYLTYNFNNINKKQQFENMVHETINSYYITKGDAVTATQFVPQEDYQVVRAVIRGETRPTTSDIRHLESEVQKKIDTTYNDFLPVRIQVRYMPVIVIESEPGNSEAMDKTEAAMLVNE